MSMKLYVGGLAYRMTEQELEEVFAAHGTVTSATIITDRDSGQSKGFGFVEMEDAEAAKKAIDALNGTEVAGRNIVVSEARPREDRRPSGGGYRN